MKDTPDPRVVMNKVFTPAMIKRTQDKAFSGWHLNDRNAGLFAIMKIVAPMYSTDDAMLRITDSNVGITVDVSMQKNTNSRVITCVVDPLHLITTEQRFLKNKDAMDMLILLAERICASTVGAAQNIMGTLTENKE